MRRTIVTPADLTGPPLQDLKSWLGVTRDAEDSAFLALLQSALEMCEAYTGIIPLEASVRESISGKSGRCRLVSRPVAEVVSLTAIASDGTQTEIAAEHYDIKIDANREAFVDLRSMPEDANEIAIDLVAGLANDWSVLAAPLRQGIVRLAAHFYRDRNQTAADEIPASVTAQWRPWRRMSLA